MTTTSVVGSKASMMVKLGFVVLLCEITQSRSSGLRCPGPVGGRPLRPGLKLTGLPSTAVDGYCYSGGRIEGSSAPSCFPV